MAFFDGQARYFLDINDTSPKPETEAGAFYVRLHPERELNRSSRIHFFSIALGLVPGQMLEPKGVSANTNLNVLTAVSYYLR